MINQIEGAQRTSDQEQKLSRTELSLGAHVLIDGFEQALLETEEFRKEVSSVFLFGESKKGWIARPGVKEVSFLVGDVHFRVTSKKKNRNYFGAVMGQELAIEISRPELVGNGLGDQIRESILLKEKSGGTMGSIIYKSNTGRFKSRTEQRNTYLAEQKAREMLARLSPKPSQK